MKVTIVGGGTATNSLVNLFSSVFDHVSYIMPISDNGGSTSEIIRVIGGPAIGDLRSRITRLIPDESTHSIALKNLFSYRLPDVYEDAKNEWNQIVDGIHPLWNGIESHYKEMIRPFFIHIHVELLKKSRPGREFRFERASIGNLFLSGARLFCGSIDSAVELLCKITDIPKSVSILPVLNTNFSYHISAELNNGEVITGQSQISHPATIRSPKLNTNATFEDANLPFSHPALSTPQIVFSKTTEQPLLSPVKRIYYINPYGQEIHPRASTRVLNSVENSNALIYSIGSLYTSISPVIILDGFAEKLRKCKKKILILNGLPDRETSYKDENGKLVYLSGEQYIEAVVNGCAYSISGPKKSLAPSTTSITGIATPIPLGQPSNTSHISLFPHSHQSHSQFSDHSSYLQPSLTSLTSQLSHARLNRSSSLQLTPRNLSYINHSLYEHSRDTTSPSPDFIPSTSSSIPWTDFVTDFIHMTEPDGIPINIPFIESHGIKCHHVPHTPGSSHHYDLQSLEQTILRIMG